MCCRRLAHPPVASLRLSCSDACKTPCVGAGARTRAELARMTRGRCGARGLVADCLRPHSDSHRVSSLVDPLSSQSPRNTRAQTAAERDDRGRVKPHTRPILQEEVRRLAHRCPGRALRRLQLCNPQFAANPQISEALGRRARSSTAASGCSPRAPVAVAAQPAGSVRTTVVSTANDRAPREHSVITDLVLTCQMADAPNRALGESLALL